MKTIGTVSAIAVAALLALPGPGARAADADRGMVLYDARCVACHNTSVHNRAGRRAKTFADVQEWVTRWSNFLGSDWGPTEIEDVSRYVNEKFYGFPCPTQICTAGT